MTQCIGNASGNTIFANVNALVAVEATVIGPPDCKTSADAYAALLNAALQGPFDNLLLKLYRLSAPLAAEFIEAAAVAGGLLGAALAAVITAAFAGAIWIIAQLGLNMAVQAAVEKAYAALFCPPGTPGYKAWHGNVKIDPSGTVLDTNGHPVSGATVTILRADTAAGPFTPEAPTSSDIDPNVNPETTGTDGVFHWDLVAGWYEVSASAKGCARWMCP